MLTTQEKKTIRDMSIGDKVTFKKDGTIVFRLGFFYRHGNDCDKFANGVLCRLNKRFGEHAFKIVEADERWNAWPKDSYWTATLVKM